MDFLPNFESDMMSLNINKSIDYFLFDPRSQSDISKSSDPALFEQANIMLVTFSVAEVLLCHLVEHKLVMLREWFIHRTSVLITTASCAFVLQAVVLRSKNLLSAFGKSLHGIDQIEFDVAPVQPPQANRIRIPVSHAKVGQTLQKFVFVVLPFVSAGV